MHWKLRIFLPLLLGMALLTVAIPLGENAHAASSVAARPHRSVVLGAVAIPLGSNTQVASSAAAHPQAPSCCGPSGYYYAVNCCTSQVYSDVDMISCLGPATCSINYTFSFSASWTANVGISASAVQASVGFSLSYSWSITPGCSITPPYGVSQTLDFQEVYFRQYFDVYWHSYYNGSNTYSGSGWAQTHSFWQCVWWNN